MPIRLTRLHELSVLTLDRPEALNALDSSLVREFVTALGRVRESDSRALVVAGAGGKAFCVGADLKELTSSGLERQGEIIESVQSAFGLLDALPIPSIAAIDGYAFGGGLELALACTFRVASTRSMMGLPETKLGLIPGYGGTQRLPRLVGQSLALEMILTGSALSAAEAFSAGLVNRITKQDVLEAAATFARTFTAHGLVAMRLAREAVQQAASTPLDEGLRLERDLVGRVLQTQDAREGMAAFVAKRPPVFQDR